MGTTRNAEVVLVEPVSKRRHRSKRERRAVVEETLQPGASVAVIARRHGVNANQVFHWRKLYREGRLDVASPAEQLVPARSARLVVAPEILSVRLNPPKVLAEVVVTSARYSIDKEGKQVSKN